MTEGEVTWLLCVQALVASMVVSLFVALLLGHPPHDCVYLVPVKAHPGVYECSHNPVPK